MVVAPSRGLKRCHNDSRWFLYERKPASGNSSAAKDGSALPSNDLERPPGQRKLSRTPLSAGASDNEKSLRILDSVRIVC